ncbi:MAG: hypothetical protein ACKPHU_15240, partial [Planctomycetaceae bacterium]
MNRDSGSTGSTVRMPCARMVPILTGLVLCLLWPQTLQFARAQSAGDDFPALDRMTFSDRL